MKLLRSVALLACSGGGESIGAEAVAKAPPDGYTLLLATSAFTAIPALQPKPAQDHG